MTEAIRKEALRKLKLAEQEKQQFQEDFTESYIFTMPHRIRPNTTTVTKPQDAKDLFTSLGPQLTADFASDFCDTFLPEHKRWASAEASVAFELGTDPSFVDQLKKALKAHDDIVFDEIAASNFYTAVKQAAKDLSISAAGVIVKDFGGGKPFHCQVIPLTELWILRDARGGIGTRFWVRRLKADQIAEWFPNVKLPDAIAQKIAKNQDEVIRVAQGCYRDYSTNAETAWIVCTLFDEFLVENDRVTGEGSAPILVVRWDPDPGFGWGIGPCINALPDYRSIDETEYLKLKGLARRIDPSFFYKDDGDINLEGGLPNGVAIPTVSEPAITVVESRAGIEEGMFATNEMEHKIRRHYFLDEPRQEGKTPPTLGQWMDESLRRQRRLSTPTAPVWEEFISECYQRFRHLLIKRGEIDPQFKVGEREFPLAPQNPLKRAALQEEAAASERFLGTLKMTYGDHAPLLMTKAGKTVSNLHTQMNATGVELKSEAEIDAVQALLQQGMVASVAAQAIGAAAPAMQAQGAPTA